MKKIIFTFASILILSSCRKKETTEIIPYQVASEYNLFFSEASKRIPLFQRKSLRIVLTDNSFPYSGLSDPENQTITLDTTSINYIFYKEQLLFHELGHYLLKRTHKDDNLSNGDIASLMHTNGFINYSGQFGYKKVYYIDELFNENTPVPYWAP